MITPPKVFPLLVLIIFCFVLAAHPAQAEAGQKQQIRAVYIPLADHYAGIVAFEKYGPTMLQADFHLERMQNWPELKARFLSGAVDLAFIISPMAMDMFAKHQNFRWVSLMHRDGNALAVNDILADYISLASDRRQRKPNNDIAQAFARAKKEMGKPSRSAVPSLQSTHTVVLYKFLKDHGLTLGLTGLPQIDVMAIEVPPPKSPAYIKKQNSRGIPASLEQSLPWGDVVESGGFGKIAWYSKDVLKWPHGHVECIAIATDSSIAGKRQALQEVITAIHRAGQDIEQARIGGGEQMAALVAMIRKHIPEHSNDVIVESLRPDLNVINYSHLNNDPGGLQQVLDLALEGRILRRNIDIKAFADDSFATPLSP